MRRIWVWGLIAFLTMLIYLFFLSYSRVGTYSRASIGGMLTGTADRPYVQRVLLPLVANALAPFVPLDLTDWVASSLRPLWGETFEIFNGDQYPRQVVVILLAMYLALPGFALITWKFIGAAGYGEFWQMLATPLILCLIPFLTFRFGHIYDFPGLFLFSAALYFLYRENWSGYYLALLLGILNKETALFLLPVFGAYYWPRLERAAFWKSFFLQAALALIPRALILWFYHANSGQSLYWFFPLNMRFMQENPHLVMGVFLFWLLLGAWISLHWSRKPLFFRTSAIILPIFVLSYLCWGIVDELRVFLDVYLIVALLILPAPRSDRPAAGPAGWQSSEAIV